MNTVDVIILGAGASGLMCAAQAAKRGKSVAVLEKANKVGKKILMSGGGKCNFTNYEVSAHHFISQNPHFCKSALKQYSQWDFFALVNEYGIAWEERKHGQLFCLDSANDILQMLLQECKNVEQDGHVAITTRVEIETIHFDNDKQTYQVHCATGSYQAPSLVIATGALSIPTLGGSGFGYQAASQFGHHLVDRRAGLVPFTFTDHLKSVCEKLSGLALEVSVSCNKQSFSENLLFTHRGMSGPVMLQISNYWQAGDSLAINLLPHDDAEALLLKAKSNKAKSLLRNILATYFSKNFCQVLQDLFWQDYAQSPIADIPDNKLRAIAQSLNHWQVKPADTEGYRTAEVTLGGVDTEDISSKTMESKLSPRLFFIGEVLDVTGHLGGYNFQWAWSSGFVAGQQV